MASPCIILSPTTAIRQQWGERFKDLFLDDEEDFLEVDNFVKNFKKNVIDINVDVEDTEEKEEVNE